MDGDTIYEIRVRGHLDSGWGDVLGLELTRQRGRTVMVGALDQAALHGVLRQIADLGLVLESVALLSSCTPST